MAGKQTALGCTITVDDSGGTGRDITTSVAAFTIGNSREPIDVTGLDKTGFERLLGRADGSLGLNGPFDNTANKAHDVFKTTGTQAGTVTRTAVVVFLGGGTCTLEVVPENYNVQGAQGGALTYSVDLSLANGTAVTWT